MAIHDRVLEDSGGLLGIREVGLLYSVAERPKTTLMGQEMFPDLFVKAASYLEALAIYHVFFDGNKRTALTVTAIFLYANGQELITPEGSSVKFMVAAATKQKSLEEIAEWLKKHSKKIR